MQKMRKEKKKRDGSDPLAAVVKKKKKKDEKEKQQRAQIKEILSGIKKPKSGDPKPGTTTGDVKTVVGTASSGATPASPTKPKKPKPTNPAIKKNFKIEKRKKYAPNEMPPCKDCNCTEFNAHPFKVNYCNRCFHNHV